MKNNNEKHNIMQALALFTQLGISMATSIFVGVMIGKYLDRWLGTSPWLLTICALIGGAASFKVMYDVVIRKWM